ncbi:plasmid mobilization protein [Sinorhizobium meliloti]|uniref:plasmid mobilization protein n=1 Tax=Rhizobium meliloti TaxID=382 RepID=UPI003DA09E16
MRDRIVRLRVTDAEAATMKDLAKARGLSLSDMVRRAALGVHMPARSLDATHAAVLARTLAEIGRIGGNLNQLVRRANSGKLIGHDAELSRTLAGIDALRQRLRDLLA